MPGEKVILALSGGPDSMALLSVLRELADKIGFMIIAAHLNHGLREEADEEARFVEDYCRLQGIPCYVKKEDIKEIAARRKKSLEEAGREERYRFFRELKKELSAHRIATAHHKDDLAETVLHHIIRGTGIKGLRGIMPVNGDLIRPLLAVTRREIEAYLEQKGIPYCIDQSNYEPVYLRNRIRHELIPYLREEFNPRLVEALCQLAYIARIENEVLEEEASKYWQEALRLKEEGKIVLDVPLLSRLHPAYQHRIIIQALKEIRGGEEGDISLKEVMEVAGLLGKTGSSRVLHLSGGVKVNKAYQELIISRKREEVEPYCYQVEIPGEIYVPEQDAFYVFSVTDIDKLDKNGVIAYLDYERLRFPLFIRSRRPGDIFRPRGLKGSKKVKDFFIDEKIPLHERDKIPLLAAEDKIYAILGIRVAEEAAVNNATQKVLVIKKRGK
ncbi:tRNA(Ile)-lysidine synthase [Thermosyntropha lipolytica DSM 11003]|uniref:tRNA(Ile)-lysidine synthase n=1 Tax=Thermosyntropha lipolytica DSM 11003 TaxID=1123382 RepID=A0A1M5JU39_9FIRM|nr:tRNA(Ile)-lysidine synthase [Thermosyntropha lipolytica DSM 11003]